MTGTLKTFALVLLHRANDRSNTNHRLPALAGSACRQSTLAMPAALARLSPSASIGPEMSNPATRPEGFAARANSSLGDMSNFRSIRDQHLAADAAST
jgi:hypothetical protein